MGGLWGLWGLWGVVGVTSRMAQQNLLCRTLCSACSFWGGISPLRCSRSSSSTARETSKMGGGERGGGVR